MRRVSLLLPERIARVSLARGADHTVDADLAAERGAEQDGNELVYKRDDFVAEVRALKVAASAATLAHDALGDRVEGDEGDGRAKRTCDFLERGEWVCRAHVQVRLVDFVGEEHEVVSLAQAHNFLHRRFVQKCASRVAWVDHDECLGRDTVLNGFLDRGLDVRRRCSPFGFLVEVVRYAYARVPRERSGVQRILRDRDENARAWVGDQHRDEQGHARGCTGG